jgi:hypothetical protein
MSCFSNSRYPTLEQGELQNHNMSVPEIVTNYAEKWGNVAEEGYFQ